MLFDALSALARGETGRVGHYLPTFALDVSEKQVRVEIKRLDSCCTLQIEQPNYYDPIITGGLSLHKERFYCSTKPRLDDFVSLKTVTSPGFKKCG